MLGKIVLYLNIFIGLLPFSVYATNELNISSEVDIQQNKFIQLDNQKENIDSNIQNPAIQLGNSIENQPTGLQNQVVQPEETKERTTSELRNQVIQLDNQGNSVLPEQQGYSNTINFVKEGSSSLGKEVANIDLVNISLIVLLIIVIFAIFILAYPMSKLTNQSETNKTNTTTGANESIKTNRVDSSMPIEGVDKSVGWHIFHKSLIGKSHLSKSPPIPCQDFNFIKEINEQWGILIVCDGAGSQKYSHKGAKFFAKKVASLMHKYIDNWISMDREDLPDNDTWRRDFKDIIYNVRADSFTYVEMQKEDISDISINNIGCTLILAVYSPYGILSAHIGDGRMGYRDESGWHSMMRPYKGEYANQTVFLNTAYIYDNLDNVNDPTNPYLETRVIKADISAIVLMSDGCEKGLYRTNEKDDNSGKYIEVNKPISLDFFIRDLSSKIDSLGKDSANKFFEQVMREGNESLSNEDDDKTLVLAYPKNKWRGK